MKKDFACGIVPVKKENNELLFLLVQGKAGFWGFPKGHQDEGEAELETAKRELFEETGIKSTGLVYDKKFGIVYNVEREGEVCEKTVVFFVEFFEDAEISIPLEFRDEIQKAEWVNFEKAKILFNFEAPKKLITEVNKCLLN